MYWSAGKCTGRSLWLAGCTNKTEQVGSFCGRSIGK